MIAVILDLNIDMIATIVIGIISCHTMPDTDCELGSNVTVFSFRMKCYPFIIWKYDRINICYGNWFYKREVHIIAVLRTFCIIET